MSVHNIACLEKLRKMVKNMSEKEIIKTLKGDSVKGIDEPKIEVFGKIRGLL